MTNHPSKRFLEMILLHRPIPLIVVPKRRPKFVLRGFGIREPFVKATLATRFDRTIDAKINCGNKSTVFPVRDS